MNENKAGRHINPEISPELFDEENSRKMLSDGVWAMIILAALLGEIKIDDIKESTKKEEI